MSVGPSEPDVGLRAVRSTREQVEEQLRDLVTSQGKRRKQVPDAEKLAASFGVSRTTVRRALETLVLEGTLEKVSGAGTASFRPTELAASKSRNKVPNFGQARRLLEEAALELFAEKGFDGTSTRSIADRAGVSEALIYRHFGSKTGLYERAVLDPIQTFIAGYAGRWEAMYASEPLSEAGVRDYVTGLYGLFRQHRLAVISLLNEYSFHRSDGKHEWQPLFEAVISDFDDVTRKALQRRGYNRADPALTLRASISLVVGMAILDGFLFGSAEADTRDDERVVNELVSMIVRGVS